MNGPIHENSYENTVVPEVIALFTQSHRIIVAVAVRKFSTVVTLHGTKQLQHKDAPMWNSHCKLALQILRRHDGTRHGSDIYVFFFLVSTY